VLEVMESSDIRLLKEKYEAEYFIQWKDGVVVGIPRTQGPTTAFGESRTLACEDYLWLLKARMIDVLPTSFPKYEAFRRKPFAFLGQRDEIVAEVVKSLRGVHELVKAFKIRPKYELDARVVEIKDDDVCIGLFLTVGTRWEVEASLEELQRAGVDLRGLYLEPVMNFS